MVISYERKAGILKQEEIGMPITEQEAKYISPKYIPDTNTNSNL